MDHFFIDVLKAAQETLEQCEVKSDETIVVLTDSGKPPAVGDAFYSAAITSGAKEAIFISMRSRPVPLIDPPEPIFEAMMKANLVVDAVSQPWPYTRSMQRICESGTRVLQVLVPAEGIIARHPDAEVVARAKNAREVLGDFRDFHITSDLGTDITFHRAKGRPVHAQDGAANHRGEWDSVGTGFAVISPVENEGTGVVFVDGTAFLPMEENYQTDKPVKLEFKDGRIVHIETDSAVARRVDSWLKSWNDPGSYVVAHTGFGIDPRAKLLPGDPGGWESILGGVNIAVGSNTVPSLGGSNLAKSHLDFVIFHANVDIDGKRVIENGEFTKDSNLVNV